MLTDQTRKFPYQLVKGHRYLLIIVELNKNVIDAEPMKDKTGKKHIKAYQELLRWMKSAGICNPKMHILDNRQATNIKMRSKKECKMQMVPPNTQKRNKAERAIQTFKNHVIAILVGVDPCFPILL